MNKFSNSPAAWRGVGAKGLSNRATKKRTFFCGFPYNLIAWYISFQKWIKHILIIILNKVFVQCKHQPGAHSIVDNKYTYSVMQSDGNSFCGDVVSDSLHKASLDVDNILEQIYIEANIYKGLKFYEWWSKMHTKRNTAHNNKGLIKLSFSTTVVILCIFWIRCKK